jgi:uncharacterized protein YcbX
MLIGTVKEIWRYPVKTMAGERLQATNVGSLGIPGDRGWAVRDEGIGEITNGKRIPLMMQCAARYRSSPTDEMIPDVDILLPDGQQIGSDAEDVNQRLSEAFGRAVTLWPRQPAEDLDHYRRKSLSARLVGPLAQSAMFRSLLPVLTKLPNISRTVRQEFSREANEPIPDLSTLPPEVIQFTSPPGTYFDAYPIHVLTTASLRAMAEFNDASIWDSRRFRPNFLIATVDGINGLVEATWNDRILKLGSTQIRCDIPTVRCGMTMQQQDGIPKDPSILRTIVKHADQNLGSYANVVVEGNVAVGDQVELI